MKHAALFDLDGVLVDTEGQYTQWWQEVGRHDFPDQPTFAHDIKGQTLTQICHKYYADDAEAPARLAQGLAVFEKHMHFPFVPGAMAFVDALRQAGVGVAVVTSSNHAKMACLYAAHPDFSAHFDRIFTAEDALRSKPAPDCYVTAARYFGLDPTACFVFEDSVNGLIAGRDSGATVIGVTTTHHEDVVARYSAYVIPHFEGMTVQQMLNLKH